MSNCCSDKACELEDLRQRQSSMLKVVLAINAIMFLVEFIAGLTSGSVSLLSDSLDMLGDSLVYAFSLYAVAQSHRTKALSALFKGGIMAAFALVALGQVMYKLAVPDVPAFETIGVVGLVALVANSVCFALLWRHRSDDINMSSVWLCGHRGGGWCLAYRHSLAGYHCWCRDCHLVRQVGCYGPGRSCTRATTGTGLAMRSSPTRFSPATA